MARTYMIVLRKPDPDNWKVLKDKWPDRHRILEGHIALVAPENKDATPNSILEEIGLKEGRRGYIFAIEHAYYTGWDAASTWEWIDRALKS